MKAVAVALLAFSAMTGTGLAQDVCDLNNVESRLAGWAPSSEDQRVAQLRQVLAECADSVAAHMAAGAALTRNADRAAAEEVYRLGMQIDPSSALPLLRLAELARFEGDQETFEIYLESARALADTDEERAELEKIEAASDPASEGASSGSGYTFKPADELVDRLHIGSKAIRPKSIEPTGYGNDYYVGEKGYCANMEILFHVGTANLRAESRDQLKDLGRALGRAEPEERYVIEGHASTEGSQAFNDLLSRKRAERIAELLIDTYEISAQQLEWVGRGIKFPVIENGVEDRTRSRRVTVVRLFGD